MKIYSVFDPEFKRYGQIVEGLEDARAEILEVLARTPSLRRAPPTPPLILVCRSCPRLPS